MWRARTVVSCPEVANSLQNACNCDRTLVTDELNVRNPREFEHMGKGMRYTLPVSSRGTN